MKDKTFEVREEHIKLLKQTYIGWDDCEFGAPSIDCKRPYGNSDVFSDIARILDIKPGDDDYDPFTDEQTSYMLRLHSELETVLQIFVQIGQMEIGWYKKVDLDKWIKVDNPSDIPKRKFEIRGVHSLNYFAVVEADSEYDALKEADLHNLIDDNFWNEDPDSWRFEIVGAEELEDE